MEYALTVFRRSPTEAYAIQMKPLFLTTIHIARYHLAIADAITIAV